VLADQSHLDAALGEGGGDGKSDQAAPNDDDFAAQLARPASLS
jgi:hypothetical protein